MRAPEISLACAALHGSRRRFHVNMGFSDDDRVVGSTYCGSAPNASRASEDAGSMRCIQLTDYDIRPLKVSLCCSSRDHIQFRTGRYMAGNDGRYVWYMVNVSCQLCTDTGICFAYAKQIHVLQCMYSWFSAPIGCRAALHATIVLY